MSTELIHSHFSHSLSALKCSINQSLTHLLIHSIIHSSTRSLSHSLLYSLIPLPIEVIHLATHPSAHPTCKPLQTICSIIKSTANASSFWSPRIFTCRAHQTVNNVQPTVAGAFHGSVLFRRSQSFVTFALWVWRRSLLSSVCRCYCFDLSLFTACSSFSLCFYSFNYSLTHSLTHPLTHSLTHSLTHPFNHSPNHFSIRWLSFLNVNLLIVVIQIKSIRGWISKRQISLWADEVKGFWIHSSVLWANAAVHELMH